MFNQIPVGLIITDANGVSVLLKIINVESPVSSHGQDNTRITVTYKCKWELRFEAVIGLLGDTKYVRSTGVVSSDTGIAHTGYLSRKNPHRWIEDFYYDPNGRTSFLYCKAISRVAGETAQIPLASQGLVLNRNDGNVYINSTSPEAVDQPFVNAIITAVYEGLPYEIKEDRDPDIIDPTVNVPDESRLRRYVEYGEPEVHATLKKGLGSAYQYATPSLNGTPPSNMKGVGVGRLVYKEIGGATWWVPGDRSVPARIVTMGKLYPWHEISIPYTWHHIPRENAPLGIAFNMVNKINETAFDIFPRFTLMLTKVSPKSIRLPSGKRGWNITYVFKHNPRGWHKEIDPLTGRYDVVVNTKPLPGGFWDFAKNQFSIAFNVITRFGAIRLLYDTFYPPAELSTQPPGVEGLSNKFVFDAANFNALFWPIPATSDPDFPIM
jgi:hypothetical protein